MGRDLHHLQASVQQREEGLRGLPLLEDNVPFRNALRLGVRQDVIKLGRVHGAKDRQRID